VSGPSAGLFAASRELFGEITGWLDGAEAAGTAGFDEAGRRDPHRKRTWVALVDGNNAQIDAIAAEAARRGITVPILIDFVHVFQLSTVSARESYVFAGRSVVAIDVTLTRR